MIEVLPIKVLTDQDIPLFGSLNVALGKLHRADLPVGAGIVISAPELHLKTILEHHDFGYKEAFEQSLTLVKKEIEKTPIPEILVKETRSHNKTSLLLRNKFFVASQATPGSVKQLWLYLLHLWINQIKERLWKDGFHKGITEGLDPQVVIFIKKIEAIGSAYFDPMQDDTVINTKQGKIHPNDLKKLDEIVRVANKKLFMPHEYEWIVDGGVKLTKILPYTPASAPLYTSDVSSESPGSQARPGVAKSSVKVFLDMSQGLVIERDIDGVYIASEKIFDLNKPRDSFEDLVFKLVECSATFSNSSILFKLADKSEGMGKVRGALRLLHQKSLFDPMIEALDFVRHKRGIGNIHVVVPFVRGVGEFLQVKRELAVKKLGRKKSLELWLEVAVPENIVNLEDYLTLGLDGVVLNLDELISHLNGFDHEQEDLTFYKNEVDGLLKFLEDGLKLMHKSKIPFIALGGVCLNSKVLEYLVEKGVYGIVVERYEAPSARELLHQAEKRMILRRSS